MDVFRLRSVLDAVVGDPDCGALATELSMREDHFDDAQRTLRAVWIVWTESDPNRS